MMAETPLPSRADAKADMELLTRNDWHHHEGTTLPFAAILKAYASGRLVDREAINYGAALTAIGIDYTTAEKADWDHVREVVDAALGEP